MPAIVACPKCQSRYQLPDNVVGKQIQCKKCGHKFAATPVAPPQAQGAAKVAVATTGEAKPSAAKTPLATSAVVARPARTIPSASAADLAKFGLDGPIQRQAEILSELPSPPPREILGNLAADPGFLTSDTTEVPSAPTTNSDALPEFLKNPFINNAPPPKEPEAPGKKGRKRKRKKRERHPEVQDSLNNATMTMAVIGVLYLLFFGFMYMNVDADMKALANNMEKIVQAGDAPEEAPGETPGEDSADMMEDLAAVVKIFYLFGMGLGVVFCVLGAGIQILPITSVVLGLLFYISLEIVGILINPWSLISMWAWLCRIVVCAALIKALVDALNARSYEKMMDAKRKKR